MKITLKFIKSTSFHGWRNVNTKNTTLNESTYKKQNKKKRQQKEMELRALKPCFWHFLTNTLRLRLEKWPQLKLMMFIVTRLDCKLQLVTINSLDFSFVYDERTKRL